MSLAEKTSLAVIIPTRDRWPILRRTLAALANQSVAPTETIVVVDGRDQQPPDLDGARVLQKDHGGPGAARNFGVEHSDAQLLLFLGDDMVPAPQLIERHLAAHDRHPASTDAVVGHVTWHPDLRRNRIHRWLDWSSTQFDFGNIIGDNAAWAHFYSCNASLNRDLFDATGGFDEEFTYYYEDLDLAWRLHEHGMRLTYERDALARHFHEYSWKSLERRFRGIAVGERLMAEKHPWFTPFFAERIQSALHHPRRAKAWALMVDVLPPVPARVRAAVERRANDWYHQKLAPAFLSVWDGHAARP